MSMLPSRYPRSERRLPWGAAALLLVCGLALACAPATAQEPALAASDADDTLPAQLTLAALRGSPERYQGRLVRWRVQYLGLERADALRVDIGPSEVYLLVRDPGGEPGFVYVVVPDSWLDAARGLTPLQRVELVGRVRDGRSPITGHPVVELVELLQ